MDEKNGEKIENGEKSILRRKVFCIEECSVEESIVRGVNRQRVSNMFEKKKRSSHDKQCEETALEEIHDSKALTQKVGLIDISPQWIERAPMERSITSRHSSISPICVYDHTSYMVILTISTS